MTEEQVQALKKIGYSKREIMFISKKCNDIGAQIAEGRNGLSAFRAARSAKGRLKRRVLFVSSQAFD